MRNNEDDGQGSFRAPCLLVSLHFAERARGFVAGRGRRGGTSCLLCFIRRLSTVENHFMGVVGDQLVSRDPSTDVTSVTLIRPRALPVLFAVSFPDPVYRAGRYCKRDREVCDTLGEP